MANPTTFITNEGWEICILVASPKALLKVFVADVNRCTAERASQGIRQVWGLSSEPAREIWWEPVQKLLRSK
ncbi:MAG: hypothetical protein ACKPKO_32025, partial [Candidatus Fonsibacter sp.]